MDSEPAGLPRRGMKGLGRPVAAGCLAGVGGAASLGLVAAVYVWWHSDHDYAAPAQVPVWLDALRAYGVVVAVLVALEGVKLVVALWFGALRHRWTAAEWQACGLGAGLMLMLAVWAMFLGVWVMDAAEPGGSLALLIASATTVVLSLALALLCHDGFARGWSIWRAWATTSLVIAAVCAIHIPNDMFFSGDAESWAADVVFGTLELLACLVLWLWTHRRAVALVRAAR